MKNKKIVTISDIEQAVKVRQLFLHPIIWTILGIAVSAWIWFCALDNIPIIKYPLAIGLLIFSLYIILYKGYKNRQAENKSLKTRDIRVIMDKVTHMKKGIPDDNEVLRDTYYLYFEKLGNYTSTTSEVYRTTHKGDEFALIFVGDTVAPHGLLNLKDYDLSPELWAKEVDIPDWIK